MNKQKRSRILKWVKALESDKYEQGTGRLKPVVVKGNEEFCCLGVACDLYAKSSKRGKWDGDVFVVKGGDREAHTLPEVVRNYYGVDDELGEDLAEMNDNSGKSFKQIAAYIRKTLLTTR